MTDPVNHPPHYKGANGIETIDVIEAFGLGFHLGNTIKYVLRAGRKNGATLEDLKKARWYLDREIARLDRATGFIHATGPLTAEQREALVRDYRARALSVEYADTLKQLQDAHCDVQFAMATALAANVGYVLTPEPMIER
jgi:hypothetical protein